MARTPSRRLVIDASVARAAGGEESIHPTGTKCRDFLEAVRTICHRVVMTPEIRDEWHEHQSSFARKWRVRMAARRKVCNVEPYRDESLLGRLQRAARSEKEHEAMLDDWHLVEAAMTTDWSVASLDQKVRQLLGPASAGVAELKRIVWVNPDQSEENCIGWLEHGAKPEKQRKLGWMNR